MNRAEKRRQKKLAKKAVGNAKPGNAIQESIDLALQHHAAGRLPEAERIYQQILQADPNQPIALHLLGVIAHQVGKNDIAVDLITKALAIKPDYAEAHYNLGKAFTELGNLGEAAASYHKALAIYPDYAEAHNNLGLALQDLGDLDEAVASYRKAIAIKSDFAEAHNNLGLALQDLGELDEAVASYHKALALNPDYTEAHNNLGVAFKKLGKLDEAVASYHKALTLNPDFAEAHSNLGLALQDLGELDEAVACCHKALDLKPDLVEAHNNLGLALQDLGKMDEAVASYRKALVLNPDYAGAHNNLGLAFQDLGELDEAVASYRKALVLNPDYAEAHRHMARIKKHSEYNEDIRAMEQAYAKPALRDEQRMHLAFGLGKAFEDLQQYEKAFGFFAEGNSIKRGSYSYSIDDHGSFFKKLKEAFDSSLFAKHQGTGCDDETPIFVLGMPRSGTTLVEQILASHPQVHGTGEQGALCRIVSSYFDKGDGVEFPESVRRVDGADFERLGREYINEVRKFSREARFITDKMLDNHFNIGVIKLALPNAKVIHCKRNPADNGLSLFKSYFPARGHYYAYDLHEIGRYCNFHDDLMEHWRSVIPGFVHDIQYEDMVADQAGQTRTLLEYCGLEWDDACLEFHKTNRPVRTASAEQVRRPIYKDSVQLWKQYETQLAPMLESLR